MHLFSSDIPQRSIPQTIQTQGMEPKFTAPNPIYVLWHNEQNWCNACYPPHDAGAIRSLQPSEEKHRAEQIMDIQ